MVFLNGQSFSDCGVETFYLQQDWLSCLYFRADLFGNPNLDVAAWRPIYLQRDFVTRLYLRADVTVARRKLRRQYFAHLRQ